MKLTFFARRALPILMIVFFLVPFAVRGARVAVNSMKNNVKDWLPSDFEETADMDWFWRHFLGERFVIASWAGCNENDESYKLLLKRLECEVPPSRRLKQLDDQLNSKEQTNQVAVDADLHPAAKEKAMHSRRLERDYDFVGDRFSLFSAESDHLNWGGLQEKWLQGAESRWYYLTPDGNLYEWTGANSPLAAQAGKIWRNFFGGTISGRHVASLGEIDGPWYYENTMRLDAQLFKTVTTGPDVLAGMTGEGGVLRDNPDEATSRLKGSLFGPDGKQTCLFLTLTDPGRLNLHRVIGRGMLGKPLGRLYKLASLAGIRADQLRLGGPTVDNVAIDEEGTITLVRLVSLCVILGVGLAYACFRTISATMMVFFVGGVSAVASLAQVTWFGSNLDAILMSMPALVYVLGISGAVHLVNYYREAVEESGFIGATEKAVAHGWKPAVLCSITTALGLFSLCTSQIVPIRNFGIFSGIAVLGTTILLFTFLPAALQLWPQKPRTAAEKQRDDHPWYEEFMTRFWDRFGGTIIRHHALVAIGCIAVISFVGYGVTRINTTVNMLKMFDGSAKILNDYAWLEQNLGKLVPMEVVVKVNPALLLPTAEEREGQNEIPEEAPFQLSFLERMEIVDRIQRVVEREFGESGRGIAGRSMSAVTFAPPLPAPKGDTLTFAKRNGTNTRLEAHRNEFLKSEYVRLEQDEKSELWRVSLRIGALQNVDYGDFVRELKCAIEPVIAAQNERELILRKLAETRENKRFNNARVLVLGAAPSTNEKKSSQNAEQAKVAADLNSYQGIDQTRIFIDSLKDLLTAARIRVEWHDPAKSELPENWAEKIASYDGIVLVSNHSQYDVEAIRKQAKLVIDATDHVYDPTQMRIASQKPNVTAVYTGVVPIVYKAQRTLLNSLIESTAWSFVTITPLMMVLARSAFAGMVAMLPNVLPVFVIFGAMGWMGIQVDIGSMMTASIALGVAVDDTIHYMTWYRQELDKGLDRHSAILAAYKRCATPTFQAAMISGLGLSIFAFSTFTPTQRFGYLMLTILFAGVVAELVFLPALLAGPLGLAFRPKKQTPGEKPQSSNDPTHPAPAGSSEMPATEGILLAATHGSPEEFARVDAAHDKAAIEAHVVSPDSAVRS